FLALIIGIVVGVGISSGGFVSKSERSLLEGQISGLRQELDAAQAQASSLAQSANEEQTFVKDSYGALIAGRLAGKRIGVVFVGPVDTALRNLVDHTLADAGAPAATRLRALK